MTHNNDDHDALTPLKDDEIRSVNLTFEKGVGDDVRISIASRGLDDDTQQIAAALSLAAETLHSTKPATA